MDSTAGQSPPRRKQPQLFLVADRAETRPQPRYTAVIPPKNNRRHPWPYSRTIYNRRIFTRYNKLDVM